MGIIGRILAPLGLMALVVAGVFMIRLGDRVQQEEAILEWSNALVSKEIGATKAPRYRSQAIRKGSQPGVWVVSGEVILPDKGNSEMRDHYVAVVHQRCGALREKRCWALEDFTLGDEEPMPQVADLPRDESATQGLSAADTGPAADAMEPSMPLSTAKGASGPTNGAATDGTASPLSERPLPETTAGSAKEEAAVVMIVTDDTAPVALPKPQNGVAENGMAEHEDHEAHKAPNDDVQDGVEVSLATNNGHEDALAENEGFAFIKPQVDQTKGDRLVFLIQDRLNRLGYSNPSPLAVDGQIGPRTRSVISSYQEANDLNADGEASLELLRHIEMRLRTTEN